MPGLKCSQCEKKGEVGRLMFFVGGIPQGWIRIGSPTDYIGERIYCGYVCVEQWAAEKVAGRVD